MERPRQEKAAAERVRSRDHQPADPHAAPGPGLRALAGAAAGDERVLQAPCLREPAAAHGLGGLPRPRRDDLPRLHADSGSAGAVRRRTARRAQRDRPRRDALGGLARRAGAALHAPALLADGAPDGCGLPRADGAGEHDHGLRRLPGRRRVPLALPLRLPRTRAPARAPRARLRRDRARHVGGGARLAGLSRAVGEDARHL